MKPGFYVNVSCRQHAPLRLKGGPINRCFDKETCSSDMSLTGTPGRHLVSIHQVAPPKRGSTHPIAALLLNLATPKGWKAELS